MKFWSFDNYDVVKAEDTDVYIVVDKYLRDKAYAPVLDPGGDTPGVSVKLADIESVVIEQYCDIDCLVKCSERFDKFQDEEDEEDNNECVIIGACKGNKMAYVGITFGNILMRKFKSKRTIDSMIVLVELGKDGCVHISQYIINSSRGVPFDLVSIDNELFLRIGKDITNIKNATTVSDKLDKEYEVLQ